MQRIIAERTATWLDRGEIDLMVEAREITFDVAAAALVGLRTGPQVDWLRERFYELLRGNPADRSMRLGRVHPPPAHSARRAHGQAAGAYRRAPRRAQRRQLATTCWACSSRARDDDGNSLSDEQLLAHVNILLVAGHETTTTLGAWVLYLLAQNPDYAARVEAELDEVLGDRDAHQRRRCTRCRSPAPPSARPADCSRRCCCCRAACCRTSSSPAAMSKPARRSSWPSPADIASPPSFADPNRFDPDRFLPPREEDRRTPYALATFGGGPRICLGINFAQVEVMALVAHVRRHYVLSPANRRPDPSVRRHPADPARRHPRPRHAERRLGLDRHKVRRVVHVAAARPPRNLRVREQRPRARNVAVNDLRAHDPLRRHAVLHPLHQRREHVELVRTAAAAAVAHPWQ